MLLRHLSRCRSEGEVSGSGTSPESVGPTSPTPKRHRTRSLTDTEAALDGRHGLHCIARTRVRPLMEGRRTRLDRQGLPTVSRHRKQSHQTVLESELTRAAAVEPCRALGQFPARRRRRNIDHFWRRSAHTGSASQAKQAVGRAAACDDDTDKPGSHSVSHSRRNRAEPPTQMEA